MPGTSTATQSSLWAENNAPASVCAQMRLTSFLSARSPLGTRISGSCQRASASDKALQQNPLQGISMIGQLAFSLRQLFQSCITSLWYIP
jgi:hypothetical protein